MVCYAACCFTSCLLAQSCCNSHRRSRVFRAVTISGDDILRTSETVTDPPISVTLSQLIRLTAPGNPGYSFGELSGVPGKGCRYCLSAGVHEA
jgi:hypothetical protein